MNKLRISKAEAKIHLQERINLGKEINGRSVGALDQFESYKREYLNWNKYNIDLLNKIFKNEEISKDYASSGENISLNPMPYENPLLVSIRYIKIGLTAKLEKLEHLLINDVRNIITEGNQVNGPMNTDAKNVITKDDLEKLTVSQLLRLISHLTLGALFTILAFLIIICSASYNLGSYVQSYQYASKKDDLSLEQLAPDKVNLLKEIYTYQVNHGLYKVLISSDGIILDSVSHKKTNIDLAKKILGENASDSRFEELLYSIPADFMVTHPADTMDNPYVVSITDKGVSLLKR